MKILTIGVSIVMMAMLFAIPAVSAAAGLSIMPWYPQGNNYVFVCDAEFSATSYDYSFGDGERLFDMTTNNVYHTFLQEGEHEVACTASNETYSKVYLLRISVGTTQTVPPIGDESAVLEIAPYFPQGPDGLDYVFICEAMGFTPTSYDWDFGDGEKLYDMPVDNVFHRFGESGLYRVNCAASNSAYRVGASKIIAGGIPETAFPPGNGSETNASEPDETPATVLSIAPYFPQGGDYVLVCDASGFTPTTYDWDFGDGSKLTDMSWNDVWHTYGPGVYDARCTARNDVESAQDTLQIIQPIVAD